MKKYLIAAFVMLAMLSLSAKTFEKVYRPKKKMVELSFDNVTIKDIKYYDGKDIVIKSSRDDVIYTEEKHFLGVSAPKKTNIWLELPEDKRYQMAYDDGILYFDNDKVTLSGSDPAKIEMNGTTMVVYDGGSIVTLYQNGDLHVNDDGEEEIFIKNDGFWVREAWNNGDYELHEDLGGFWGKALAAVIGVAVRTAMNAIGETPAEVAVSVLKEKNWKGNVDAVMDNIPKEKINLNSDRFKRFEVMYIDPINVKTLAVDNFNGKIDIETSDVENIEISITITSEKEKYLNNVEIINKEGVDTKLISKALVKNPRCSVNYEIVIPKSVELGDIESSNGRIEIKGCRGDAMLETANGSIAVKNFEGNLNIRTSNGKVQVVDIAGNVNIRTSNGKVLANGISGSIYAKSSNGGIDIESCGILEGIETSNASIYAEISDIIKHTPIISSNGSIKVILQDEVKLDVHAKTTNGTIDLHGINVIDLDKRKNKFKGELNGGGNLLDIETSNANVNIYKK